MVASRTMTPTYPTVPARVTDRYLLLGAALATMTKMPALEPGTIRAAAGTGPVQGMAGDQRRGPAAPTAEPAS